MMLMKRIILIAILFVNINNNSSAQAYHPFKTDSATWTIVEYGFTIPLETGTYHFGLAGDTVINGIDYTKIYINWGWLGSINPEPVFNLQTANYYGAFREDASKKVWFYKDGTASEILYYDFSLNPGDTFCFDYQPCGVFCHPVSLVDSTLIDGNYHRQIHFNYGGQEEIWIEGIGSAYDNWIGEWCFIGNILWTLNCYSEKGIQKYGTCDYPTAVAEISTAIESFHLSPNPAGDRIYLTENTAEQMGFTVFNSCMKQIIKMNFSASATVNTSDFAAGIYFYTVKGRNGKQLTGKFIKN
jgi:hypothetical protein